MGSAIPSGQLRCQKAPTKLPHSFICDYPIQVGPAVMVRVVSIEPLQQQVHPRRVEFGKVYAVLLGPYVGLTCYMCGQASSASPGA